MWKKQKHSIHFIIRCSWKYTCTDYFLLLIDSHARYRVHWRHIPALCLLIEKQKKGGGVLLWFVWSYSTVKMCHVFSEESTYQPTVWPVVIKYTVFLCLLSISSVLELQAGLFVWNSNSQPGQKTLGGRIPHYTLKLNQHCHTNALQSKDQKHQPDQEWCTDSWGESVINSHEIKR